MDHLSPEQRSANMRRIEAKDTEPELCVRKLLTKLGYRYRLHRDDLPGKPDIFFPGRKVAIFVHGVSGIAMHARNVEFRRVITTIGCRNFREIGFAINVTTGSFGG